MPAETFTFVPLEITLITYFRKHWFRPKLPLLVLAVDTITMNKYVLER